MVYGSRIVLCALFAVILAGVAHADIVVGSKRTDVIAELGKPTSAARRGTHEILIYPKGVRIELDADQVVDLKGYVPTAATTVAPAGPSAPRPADPVDATKKAPVAAEESYNPAIAANALGDEVAKMDTAWGSRPPDPIHKPELPWPKVAVGLLLRFILTLIALRLAFKYWEMDAFWSGTLAIAGIDIVLHAILEALGPATGGFTTMGGVENSLPALIMIFTIRHFCFNKRLQNAVLTASAVKGVVMILNIFLYIALLNALFGGSGLF